MNSTLAAWDAFRRSWNEIPNNPNEQEFDLWAARYQHMWDLYQNDKFENLVQWAGYKARYGLYRHIRGLYNPTQRIVDFYGGIIYPGVLTADGLPDGDYPSAIPLNEDIPDALRLALVQLWQWSNWGSYKNLMGRWGALLGNVFVEIVDDVERGKVYLEVVWPGLLQDLEVDGRGNVKAYAIEYKALDDNGQTFTYRREVNQEAISVYHDDRLVEQEENPYGFTPAIWCPHFVSGGLRGQGAVRHLAKFDAINDQLSILADKVRKMNSAPIVAWGGGTLGNVSNASRRDNTSSLPDPQVDRDEIKILQGPAGGKLETLTATGVEETIQMVRLLIEEVEDDHPELTMYKQLRNMSIVTGPGAERVLGEAATYVNEARSNYDAHSVRLFQMAVAIAGMRVRRGDWGRGLTPQQVRFAPFDLTSYQRGELDFHIQTRPLVMESPMERLQRRMMEVSLQAQLDAAPLTGILTRLRREDERLAAPGVQARLLSQAQGENVNG